jgi:two-component system nitrogen regulation sensor histidine kinase NtrY
MIDQLAISAELLAQSERESAWREMARQIAHEIKNPLTPMKLTIQHLQHAWNSQAPDWDKRLQKFTKTMIEQIDTLSIIASEFSSFAKISHDKKEDINLLEVIQSSINLFSSAENISIVLKTNFEELWIEADKTQIIRAFNNLIKNAYQAIGLRDDGKIIIELLANTENCIIKIRDNGLGISPELTDKIFKPYFTTKSSGLGLGLAIVKSIIIDMGGADHLCFGCRCRNHLYYHIAAKEKFLVLKRNIPIFPWFESMHL